jgi:hypothetical protein
LADVAILLNERGLLPDELHRLKWEEIASVNGRYGALSVHYGKPAARRKLQMTPGVRCILEARHVFAGQPVSGWIFPAEGSNSGRIQPEEGSR